MKYCKYCGKEISETAEFCPYCGKVVDGQNSNQQKENAKVDYNTLNDASPLKTRQGIKIGIGAGIIAFIAVLIVVFVKVGDNGASSSKPALFHREVKMSQKDYTKRLDAYLDYCQKQSQIYENMVMTLTMDAENKPILLLLYGSEYKNTYLEVDTYVDGEIKTLQNIKLLMGGSYGEIALLKANDGMIAIFQNGGIVLEQIKDDSVKALFQATNDKHLILCYGETEFINQKWEEYNDFTISKYEKEIKEWLSCIHGDDNHYMEYFSLFDIDELISPAEGGVFIDDMPLSFFSGIFFAKMFPEEDYEEEADDGDYYNDADESTEENAFVEEDLLAFRSMVQQLKEEPCYTWKDFFMYDSKRISKLYFGKISSYCLIHAFPEVDISWYTESSLMLEMPFVEGNQDEIDKTTGWIGGWGGVDGLYPYLLNIGLVDTYTTQYQYFDGEWRDWRDIAIKASNNIDKQWICEYLDIKSIEDVASMNIDNKKILLDFDEWVQSKERDQKFAEEYKKVKAEAGLENKW